MGLSTTALIGLACFLANGPKQMDRADFYKYLQPDEILQVEQLEKSEICLPEKFEKMIKPQILNGRGNWEAHEPTFHCDRTADSEIILDSEKIK